MKIIILPGYSIKNKEWAQEAVDYFLKENANACIHNWNHWKQKNNTKRIKQTGLNIDFEVDEILKIISDEKVFILAKSIGTRVAMKLLIRIPRQIEKLILCGIPSIDDRELKLNENIIEQSNSLYQMGLKNISADKIICFQNSADPLANYQDVKHFLETINFSIKLIEKPGNDHHYPYYEDFAGFFTSN